MPKFRKKPVVIEAWRARDLIAAAANNWDDLPKAIADAYETGGWVFTQYDISIPTLEGTMTAGYTDFIIMGVNGEFYPCKPDIFEKTYDPA